MYSVYVLSIVVPILLINNILLVLCILILCMHVRMNLCMSYLCVCIHAYACIYLCICTYVYVCMHVRMCMHMDARKYSYSGAKYIFAYEMALSEHQS